MSKRGKYCGCGPGDPGCYDCILPNGTYTRDKQQGGSSSGPPPKKSGSSGACGGCAIAVIVIVTYLLISSGTCATLIETM